MIFPPLKRPLMEEHARGCQTKNQGFGQPFIKQSQ